MRLVARALPPLLSLSLLSGCLVELGVLPQDFDAAVDAGTDASHDGGQCGVGAPDPSDLCLACRGGVLVPVCARSVVHTSFDDFAAGDHSSSPTNLHVGAAGSVHVVTAGDIDGDRRHDVLIGNYLAGDLSPLTRGDPSFLFLGRPDRTFVLGELLNAGGVRGAAIADLDLNGSVDVLLTYYETNDLST